MWLACLGMKAFSNDLQISDTLWYVILKVVWYVKEQQKLLT